jgi:hypothetical protein
VLDEETEEVNSCLGALDGTSAKVRAYFDVTAGLIKSGHYITIEMWLSNAPSLTQVPFSTGAYTKVAERQYEKGNALYDEYLEATTTLPANTRVLLMLRYSDATTPSVCSARTLAFVPTTRARSTSRSSSRSDAKCASTRTVCSRHRASPR